MPFPVRFDLKDSIIIIEVYREVKRYDALLVTRAIADLGKSPELPLLLDFRPMAGEIANVAEWGLFVKQLLRRKDQRVAMLSSAVGHSTPCQLIAIEANGDNQNAQAFQSESEAREWLCESNHIK